jgi:D-glycero-D-manno-heptose 1,7-bisphosphate phosphatase
MPDAPDALARLKAAGFLLICVTNQPEVPRGQLRRDALDAINAAVRAALPLDDLLMCLHSDEDGCDCRKPLPGLLLQGAREHDVELRDSFMVGDRWRDIGAGHAAGCRTVLIQTEYENRAPVVPPDATVKTIGEAAKWILNEPSVLH